MARTTDVDAQRAVIAAAVAQLVAAGGIETVSLRAVAAQAGVSMGRVQHYFRTKDELLLDCLQRSYRQMETRVQQRVAGSDGDERAVLVAILEEILGVDAETRDAIRITTAFAARAPSDERIAAVLTDGDEEIIALATKVIADAAHHGRTDVTDPEVEGRVLFALVCGLGSGVALYGAPVDVARATLAHHLNRVAPPRSTVPAAPTTP